MTPNPSETPVERVVSELRARGCNPRATGPTQWTSRCPVQKAHKAGDRNPSLSVAEGVDGKALIHCHAGCPLPVVAGELGLSLRDLFPERAHISSIDRGQRIRATYDYYSVDGELLFQVVRYDPKTFRQRRLLPNGEWEWSTKGVEKPLYHAPQVRAAIEAGHPIWIVEGEKDAENLAWHVSPGVATTNPQGAGKWQPQHTDALQDAPLVNIVADDDEAGHNHARVVAQALEGWVGEIHLWLPHEGHNDISEHLGAGRGLDEMRPMDDSPAHATVDLDELLATEEEPYDWLIPGLIERGDRLILTGVEGQGKSTLLRQVGVQAASGIHPFTLEAIDPLVVLDVDCENSRRQVRRKAGALRAAAGEGYSQRRMLFEFRPDGIDLTKGDDYGWLVNVVSAVNPDLLIIGPSYKMAGGDPTEEQTAKAVTMALDSIRVQFGCALLIEAHTPYQESVKAKRVERPYGASLWSRWPEFGLFLDPDGALRHWRGQRDEREWPVKLERGEPWPWMVTEVAEVPSDDPWRPSHCIDAIVNIVTADPTREFSGRQLRETLAFSGESYRTATIGFAAEQAAREGLVVVRNGPRNSRLFKAQPVDNSDRFPPVPTGSHRFPEPVGGGGNDRFPLVPEGGYVVPPYEGTSEPALPAHPVPIRELY